VTIASRAREFARTEKVTALGASIVCASVLLAIVGPWLAPYDPQAATSDILLAPSGSHPFGTDKAGIDTLSVVLAGFRADILIALGSIAISLVGGVLLGAIAGFAYQARGARRVGWVLLRLADVVQTIPVLILALALVGMTGPSVRNVVISVAFVNLPMFFRITRGAILVVQQETYVDAARSLGLSDTQLLARHVLPNSMAPVVANASIAMGASVLLTASLSYVGAGVRPPTPEWGATMAAGAEQLVTGEWWLSVLPGLVLAIVVLGFALVGKGLERQLDPLQRQRVELDGALA
jgi:peptide/nickel transport system permease protein